jgi:hypothetical protein
MASNSQLPHVPPTEPDSDETGRYDDSVIGRALQWSVAAVVVIALLAAAAWFWLGRQTPAPAPRMTQLAAPTAAPSGLAQAPTVKFTDVTEAAGIRFSRFNGAEGEKLLPETMGGGGAFLDYDGDGDQDLFLVNGAPWPWSKAPNPPSPTPTQALYQNEGNGQFREATQGSGLDLSAYGMGAACGDFDNDGLDRSLRHRRRRQSPLPQSRLRQILGHHRHLRCGRAAERLEFSARRGSITTTTASSISSSAIT